MGVAKSIVELIFKGDASGAIQASKQVRQELNSFKAKTAAFLAENRAAMVGGVAAGVAAAALAVKQGIAIAAKFEDSMAAVATATGATSKELAALSNTARVLSQNVAGGMYSATDAAEAMYSLGSAGYNADQVTKALTGTLNLAAASNVNLAEASETVVKAISMFGLQAEDAGKVSDVFTNTIKGTLATFNSLSISFAYIGPLAKSLGWDMADAAAALGLLYNKGLDASMAATGLRQGMAQLLKPSNEASQAMKRLGISFEEVNPATVDLITIIKVFEKAGLDAKSAIEIFGIRGQAAMLALAQSGGDALEKLRGQLDKTGSASEDAATRSNTYAGAIKRLRSTIDEAAIDIFGENLKNIAFVINSFVIPKIQALSRNIKILQGYAEAAGYALNQLTLGFTGIGGEKSLTAGLVKDIDRTGSKIIDARKQIERKKGGLFGTGLFRDISGIIKFEKEVDSSTKKINTLYGQLQKQEQRSIVLGKAESEDMSPAQVGKLIDAYNNLDAKKKASLSVDEYIHGVRIKQIKEEAALKVKTEEDIVKAAGGGGGEAGAGGGGGSSSKLADTVLQITRQMEQDRIEAMKDGADKRIAQIRYERQVEISEAQQQSQENGLSAEAWQAWKADIYKKGHDKIIAEEEAAYQERLKKRQEFQDQLDKFDEEQILGSGLLKGYGAASSAEMTANVADAEKKISLAQTVAEKIKETEREITLSKMTEHQKSLFILREEYQTKINYWQQEIKHMEDMGILGEADRARMQAIIDNYSQMDIALANQNQSMIDMAAITTGIWQGTGQAISESISGAFTSGASAGQVFVNAMKNMLINILSGVIGQMVTGWLASMAVHKAATVTALAAEGTAVMALTGQYVALATAKAAAGMIGGPLGFLGGLFGHEGGLVPAMASGGPVQRLAGGGFSGWVPGFGMGDKVPALLEPGEFVMSRRMVSDARGGGAVNNSVSVNIYHSGNVRSDDDLKNMKAELYNDIVYEMRLARA